MKTQTKIKTYKPYTPSRRFMSREDYSEITRNKPEKSLTKIHKKNSGRDNTGQISIRHRGGGSKRKMRIISSLQDRLNIPAKVLSVEYDPNRSARIMLVKYKDDKKAYILAPGDIKVGNEILASEKTPVQTGNRMKLKNMQIGTEIYDIEITPDSRGKLVRSAGSAATLAAQAEGVNKRGNYVQIKLPSGEIRLIHKECFASIGRVSNITHSSYTIGKAGRVRWMGRRPVVRGKAMNAHTHPHGGGEGGSSIGLKHPKTPWGKPALGYKTRRNKRTSKFILQRRKK